MKTLLPILALVLCLGCASTPQERLAMYALDAYDLGLFGGKAALVENEDYRDELEVTAYMLELLEQQPDPLTVDSLTAVLAQLPLKDLQSDKAQLYIVGGRIMLRRLGSDQALAELGGIRPIIVNLRKGLQDALAQDPVRLMAPPVPQ